MPVLFPIIRYRGYRCLDGYAADSIPLEAGFGERV